MAEPMKIRATQKGDGADVRVLVLHPMETGQRKDSNGGLVPMHFIQQLSIQHNGKTVLEAHWSQGIARNPLLGLRLKRAKTGDRISVSWTDNRGDQRTDEATIAAA